MSTFELRSATRQDLPVVLTLVRALAAFEKLSHEVVATEADYAESLFGARPAAEVVLAFEGNQPVGLAIFFENFSTFLGKRGIYLEDIFVTPEARGRGCGRALLSHIGRIATARDCGRIEWAVLDWNDPAIEFYRKLGAVPMEEWTVFRLTGDGIRQLAEGRTDD